MSWTNKITTEAKYKSRTMIHGGAGVGKTHCQAHLFPKPFWIDMDNSLTHKWSTLPKFNPNNFGEFWSLLEEIANEEKSKDIDTVIIDIDHVINQFADGLAIKNKWKNIEGEGFNHEWKVVKAELRKVFRVIERVNEKYHVCFTAHSAEARIKAFELDVTTTKMRPNLHKEVINDVVNWCNTIFHIHTESDVILKQVKGKQRSFMVGKKNSKKNIRMIEMSDSCHYEAKNRCDLPESAFFDENFDYNAIRDAVLGAGFDAEKFDTGFEDIIENSDNTDILSQLKEHEEAVLYYCINHYYSLKQGQTLDELTEKSINEISDDVERFIERSVEKFDEYNKRKNAGQEGMDI